MGMSAELVKQESLTIALAKGYLFKEALILFKKVGIEFDIDVNWDRRLSAVDKTGKVTVLQVRPWDVPEYIEHGAADLGVVGRDVLIEKDSPISPLLDLKFGGCKLVLAGLSSNSPVQLRHNMRVATKYPHSTEEYFRKKGLKIRLIKLYGAVELAPLTGLSDVISDLTATGKTLKENQLSIMDTIYETTALLVANPVSLKFRYQEILLLLNQLRALV